MASLTNTDKQKLEALFGMETGYVLDFTNRTFQDFLLTCVQINPYQDKYKVYGTSKANVLRAFWDIEPDSVVGKLLSEMLERWKTNSLIFDEEVSAKDKRLYEECQKVVSRLTGKHSTGTTAEEFLSQKLEPLDIVKLNIGDFLRPTIEQRIDEIAKCMNSSAPLAAIFLCGSTLEGVLLEVASRNSKEFKEAKTAPTDRKTGKVLNINDWRLANLIDVACELGIVGQDVRKFGHGLRDFRNYIHPHEQASQNFAPDMHTAQICYKVLQTAFVQLSRSEK